LASWLYRGSIRTEKQQTDDLSGPFLAMPWAEYRSQERIGFGQNVAPV